MKKPDSGRKTSRRLNLAPEPATRSEDVVAESDPLASIIMPIVRVVPAARWAFAQIAIDGRLERLLTSPDSRVTLAELDAEVKRQRATAKSGPRIAAALTPFDAHENAVTLLFADSRATYGVLLLTRNAELGPFTSLEVSILTFALAAVSDQLAALRMEPLEVDPAPRSRDERRSTAAERPEAAFYVLNHGLEIVLAWQSEEQSHVALSGVQTRIADRLPRLLEETVRDLTSAWDLEAGSFRSGRAHPVPFLVVRTQPMSGPAGLFVGVRIDRFRPPNSLTAAATRFHISPRELQVLSLLLEGAHLDEIGNRLHITSSTVQDHIRSMVEKTESRNRTELVARIFGWGSMDESVAGT